MDARAVCTLKRIGPVVPVTLGLAPMSLHCPSPLTFAGSPESLHAVAGQHDACQLRERLCDVEVAQGADLEEGHAQTLGVHLRMLSGHLSLVGQVQTVAHQDLGHTWSMLGNAQRRVFTLNNITV